MIRYYFLMLCFLVVLPINVYSANEDLKEVLFPFDQIPCGGGTIKRSSSTLFFPVETRCNEVPVLAHIFIKDFKQDFDSYKPLDPYVIISYYRERINNEYNFTLIGYSRRYYLGSSKKEIVDNYAKIHRDLTEVLGPETNLSKSNKKTGIDKTTFWVKPRNDNGLGITLSTIELNKKMFASIEVVCHDEYLYFRDKEEKIEKEKQNKNIFK